MAEHVNHNGGIIAALRSVYFYYLSCSPCRKVGHRRDTRKAAEREAGLKARLEMEQPGLYQHPNPENTNQYWLEDINMGPSLSKNKVKRGESQATSQRHLQSADTTELGPSRMPTAESPETRDATSPVLDRSTSIGSSTRFHTNEAASSPTVVADELEARTTRSVSVTDLQDLDWNKKRYDREDEELWGSHVYNKAGQRIREAITKGKDTAGRLFDASRTTPREREITEEERVNFYTAPRNPPVNEYHPPVVSSRPASKHEFKWMLQPPPSAKIMEGKVPVNRSGSLTSVTSRRTTRTTAVSLASKEELGLGRLVGEKIVKDKIRNGERPNGTDQFVNTSLHPTRPRSYRARTGSTVNSILNSGRSTRSRSDTTSSESSDTIFDRRIKRREERRKAVEAAAGSEADEDTEDEGGPSVSVSGGASVARRPHLQSIGSSDLGSQHSEASDQTVRQSTIAALSTEPATSRSLSPLNSDGSPLEDVTNRSPSTAAYMTPPQSPDKERPAGASLDSGLALS